MNGVEVANYGALMQSGAVGRVFTINNSYGSYDDSTNHEFAKWDRVLNPDEIATVETTLMAKWQIE